MTPVPSSTEFENSLQRLLVTVGFSFLRNVSDLPLPEVIEQI